MLRTWVLLALGGAAFAQPSQPQFANREADYTISGFTFHTGDKLDLRLHYTTLGQPARDSAGHVRNAVIIMHGTGGTGRAFLSDQFAGELFGSGQPLDITKYFVILPDALGHGKSSKPSDGLHMRFPHYDYEDMVRADYALLHDGLNIDHMRLIMGTSMGAMHSWVFGYLYPDFMDALMPLASAPVEIAGRNRMFRDLIMMAIRGDPAWNNGEYTAPPTQGLIAAQYSLWMMGTSPLQLHKRNPTHQKADAAVAELRERALRTDANDMLYYYDASTDYNPSSHIGDIKATLFAINSADDEVNPPELGIMEREIRKAACGRFILLPISDETRGHGTHSRAVVWKQYLVELLRISAHGTPSAPADLRVKIDTGKGSFVIEAHRAWAPNGVDRFYNLVRNGFFDDSRFFRVLPHYIAQFGIPGDPSVAAVWRTRTIRPDPEHGSNRRGTVGYAMVTPDARTTQLYINLADNFKNDRQGFTVIGTVVEGMDVVDRLYSGYGETSGGGMRMGTQQKLFEEGNSRLDREFPNLDHLIRATIF
jgi:homoserine O-acetyltransferase/O-succinyltransferase